MVNRPIAPRQSFKMVIAIATTETYTEKAIATAVYIYKIGL
ncbi:MAG: hypothetical protein AAFR77_15595 [Cyanobacteria bacterium J06631_2]